MNHLLILPIIVPLACGCLLLLARRADLRAARGLSLLSSALQLALAALLFESSRSDVPQLYTLGGWLPPYGIVLVLDRLAALMLLTTALLALPALIYATAGADRRGKNFHALFQFQLMGINGAFLTGDLFNLFVFFEVLLIASYGLLLHGLGAERIRAGLHYVLLNLLGSALFLIAAGIFYGLSGTLNLADLSVFIAVADANDAPLLAAAGLLLLIVFGLKAAMFPLYFWLPRSYAAASAPVAALFAIMTKIGVYGVLRMTTLLFGAQAGLLANLLLPWLMPLAIITLLLGGLGALAATTLAELIAYLVMASVGTLLSALALDSVAADTALLYYLLHSTWIIGALFLLADLIAAQRGASTARLQAGAAMAHSPLLSCLFVVAAMSVAGLPPLAGFIGKIMLLQAALLPAATGLWLALLVVALIILVALSRAGSVLFWRIAEPSQLPPEQAAVAGPLRAAPPRATQALCAVAMLLTINILLSVAAEPVVAILHATAQQLRDARIYSSAVLAQLPMPAGAAP